MTIKPFISFFTMTLALVFVMNQAVAKENDFKPPLGCRDAGYKFDLRLLKVLPGEDGQRHSLYFVYNMLDKPINLYQMRPNDGTGSLYLNHTIRGGQWGVLSTCEKEIKYICTVDDDQSSHGKIVDCAQGLRICEYANVAFGLNTRGNHWLVSSSSKNSAVRQVVHYGIIPR